MSIGTIVAYIISMYVICGAFVRLFYGKKLGKLSDFVRNTIEFAGMFSPMTGVVVMAAAFFRGALELFLWPRIIIKEIKGI